MLLYGLPEIYCLQHISTMRIAMLRRWKSTMFGKSPVPSPTNDIIEAKKDSYIP